MIWSSNITKEISDIITLPTVLWINLSLMEKHVSSVHSHSLSSIFLPNNVLIVLKTNNLILLSDSVLGNHIILTSRLWITGLKMAHRCLSLKDSLYLVLLKNLTIMVKDVKFVLCPNIGASRKTLVFNVQQEQFLIQTITNVKSRKLMSWQFYKEHDGWLMTAILLEL